MTILKLKIAVVFVSMVLAVTNALAQVPDLSIGGVRIGMTPEQVRATIRVTIKPGYREVVNHFPSKELSGFADVKSAGNDSHFDKLHDVFFFTFWNGSLIGVSRYFRFKPGTEPSLDKMTSDLKGKYGEPEPNVGAQYRTAEWRFKDGNFVPMQLTRSSSGHTLGPSCIQQITDLPNRSPLVFDHGTLQAGVGFIQPAGDDFCSDLDYLTVTLWPLPDGSIGAFGITLSNRTPIHERVVKLQERKAPEQKAEQR
jgi:hypothetical protein